MRRISVLTHRRTDDTAGVIQDLAAQAASAGVTLCFDSEETRKHGLSSGGAIKADASGGEEVELCIVLGGDGTILRAIQRYAGTEVPVFAINFGEIGFLATVEPDEIEEGMRRALAGDFELLRLPAIVLDPPRNGAAEPHVVPVRGSLLDAGQRIAINDLSIHRKVGERVAEVAYALGGEVLGSVRCDGLVVSTPAGSTGYNLANGGPVMAWGVEGFVVSFIAPHSLTARALVAAPSDRLEIYNRSREALEIALDGRPAGELEPEDSIAVRFLDAVGTIAQLPGSTFYRRLSEKFGRLAT